MLFFLFLDQSMYTEKPRNNVFPIRKLIAKDMKGLKLNLLFQDFFAPLGSDITGSSISQFLDASTHFYKRLCLSIQWSVGLF